ncbi:MAG: hypothetical protein ACHQX0_05110, partial [Desulfobaccales bacterium]
MGGNLQHGRRLGLVTPYKPQAAIGSSHPAVGVQPFATPDPPTPQNVGSFGLGRQYSVPAGGVPMRPGEISLRYGGGYIDTHIPYRQGFVDRAKQTEGVWFGWVDGFRKLAISALAFQVRGTAQKSSYQQYGHLKTRFAMDGSHWAVVKAMSNNTGFVAPTTPGAAGGSNATPGGLRQGYRYTSQMAPRTPIPFA